MYGNETKEQNTQEEFNKLQECACELLDSIEFAVTDARDDIRDFRLQLVILENLRKNLTA